MKTIDCFMFFNELDLLEIRLEYLYDKVDNFVLVESCYTQLGNPKPFYFEENKTRYSKYLDKIVHIKIEEEPQDKTYCTWTNENYQRNQIIRGLTFLNLDRNDIVIISDLDEIINQKAIEIYKYIDNDQIYSVKQNIYYYFLNFKAPYTWNGPQICRYSTFTEKGLSPQHLRDHRNHLPLLAGGEILGWHFAYQGNPEKILEKITSICESNCHENFKDINKIKEQINYGNLYFNNNTKLTPVPLDDSFPFSITQNKEKYKDMINE